jgi:tetratricopeptide (TPR) repeat protein
MKASWITAVILVACVCGCSSEFWAGKKRKAADDAFRAKVGEVNIQIDNGHLPRARAVADELAAQVASNFGSSHANNAIAMLELASLQPAGSTLEIDCFKKALAIQESTFGESSHEAATVHALLGRVYRADPSHARPHIEAAVKNLQPKDNPDAYSLSAYRLADIQEATYDFAAAQDTRRRAITTLQQQGVETTEHTIPLMHALAATYEQIGKYPEAESWYRKILEAYARQTQPDKAEQVAILRRLATVNYLQDKMQAAKEALIEALSISKSLDGGKVLHSVVVLVDQATIEESQGNRDKAQSIREDIDKILEAVEGVNKNDILTLFADPNLESLSAAYTARGKHDQAKAAMQRILEMREKRYGARSPQLIGVLNSLATLEQSLGNPKAVESIYGRVDSIVAGLPKENLLPRISHQLTLGDFYLSELQVEKAEESYKKALSLALQAYLVNDPIVARCFDEVVGCYESQNKNAELEALLKTRLASLTAKLGQRHLDLAPLYQKLAQLYRAIGETENAKDAFQNYMQIVEDHIGEANSETANTLLTMAEIYTAQGATAEAESVYSRLIPMYQKVYGFDHWRIGRCLLDLAAIQSDPIKAKGHYRRALTIYENAFGHNHPYLIGLLKSYAEVVASSNDSTLAKQLQERAEMISKQHKVPQR